MERWREGGGRDGEEVGLGMLPGGEGKMLETAKT